MASNELIEEKIVMKNETERYILSEEAKSHLPFREVIQIYWRTTNRVGI